MRTIALTQGQVALVDDEDYERLTTHKWQVFRHRSGKLYAARTRTMNGVKVGERMHRVITGAGIGTLVDHINGNTLDNQKSNLRICTNSENMCNRGKQKDNTSGYKGVLFKKKHKNPWFARIKKDKIIYPLGYFNTPKEAAIAYNNKAMELHGEFARLNEIPPGEH